MSSVQVRVLALFSVGYFVSYVFRGVNLGFAPFVTHGSGCRPPISACSPVSISSASRARRSRPA